MEIVVKTAVGTDSNLTRRATIASRIMAIKTVKTESAKTIIMIKIRIFSGAIVHPVLLNRTSSTTRTREDTIASLVPEEFRIINNIKVLIPGEFTPIGVRLRCFSEFWPNEITIILTLGS
jgi:hypothetical protein